ncbi:MULTISPECIES: hypothetical protein [unclassified Streptomyces]|uniref:hypothetical protein n=1 Tax=unclassified Streptomyces TaxID=2593676 RepID=UPI0008855520|nr:MULTISPECIES: hypothetical protein [unclassified Streptomyces]PBC81146.1 hypothetical protein BX261_1005 [Streptomyces sp. 2321.6]SDR56212.1 hypothetical protein SAMN05216511_6213 [Streptomyces sp. KS_16]SEC03135.1 hypothetical protein SAMN05428940_1004 [Streptomyces sp. 2133.1]SEF10030.1 hypothetical protein SAMN05428954_6270 [Streptomyces sp. 2112.3]SNC63945.1 hypothetical protein SAMN06272741_1003 [Streptomyces sp. 2114.4]
MERVLNLLLIRFGLIAGALVALGLLVFAVALVLKRRGKLGAARRYAAPAAHAVSRYLDDRGAVRGRGGMSRGGGSVAGAVVRAAARHLDGDGRGQRQREPGRDEVR